ncbi:hypothetical protein F2P56_029774 [Juglans regia]|uniref:Uncharacterized protein LOC109003207 isoform X1 n=2 Tax=Juglans regia TaxID=51240 RepID=A0A2I4FYS3_JUGRE|nr:uncharacterized protein LOC109003207 isoform X1 [Juglans regia]KAF5449311.1 hypothetical protein F2P56_029774 [Juglans regia]
MALPIGKLTILVGAGIVGSVLAKEGRISTVSDFVSGAFKIVLKQIKQDDSSPSVSKPRNDSLMAQVNSLRQELQMLASNRPITIVTSSQRGATRYGVIIIVVVLGYGYVWWKGWKLPDMMFASRRSLSDACNSIAKQLESVYSSISATKRGLSSRMDVMDSTLDECAAITSETQQDVSELRKRTDFVGVDVINIHDAVQTLETKISRIEGKQDLTNEGVRRLCGYAWSMQNSRTTESIQASPSSSSRPALEPPATPSRVVSASSFRPALEPPPVTPLSRQTGSLPPVLSPDPLSPSDSSVSRQNINGITEVDEAARSQEVSNGIQAPKGTNNGTSSSGLFGLRLPGISASFLTRTFSAAKAVPQQTVQRVKER